MDERDKVREIISSYIELYKEVSAASFKQVILLMDAQVLGLDHHALQRVIRAYLRFLTYGVGDIKSMDDAVEAYVQTTEAT